MNKDKSKYKFSFVIILLSLINCISSHIGNGYSTKSSIPVYTKPDKTSLIKFEVSQKSNFSLLEKIEKKDSKLSKDWWKIKKDNQIGYLEDNGDSSYLIFLNLKKPKYGLVIATSLFLRSEPSTESKPIEKLKTKDILEVMEDSNSSIAVNGKIGFWFKVKTKSENIGFVFSPYIMIGDSVEYLSTLIEFETEESGWVYIKNKPNYVFKLQNRNLVKIANEQIEENNFYFVKSRYVTKDGKIFFRVTKQNGRQEDWYSEIEYTILADCYLPAESVFFSNKYASLYSKIKSDDKTEIKLFNFLSKEFNSDLDPEYTTIESFRSKKNKFYMLTTTLKYEDNECIGCFLAESENIVLVLKEIGNSYEIIFHSSGYMHASIYSDYTPPKIIIRDGGYPESDEEGSTIYSYEYEFKNEKFDFTNKAKE